MGLLTLGYTTLALVAFAANSVLCRLALREATIDPATFTTIRFVSGALMLLLVASRVGRPAAPAKGSWTSAGVLTAYAFPFSFAYTRLSAGTGALILFGSVQVTMVVASITSGERARLGQWAGLSLALVGLVVLVFPGLTAPPPVTAILMAIAGICWGIYSLRARGVTNPLAQTTSNFVRTVPLVVAVSLLMLTPLHAEAQGVVLSVASGAVTSGLGYVVWYAALRKLTGMQAAIVQLAVPVLAAAGGVIFLTEVVSARLVLSTVMVLGGIALAVTRRAANVATEAGAVKTR